MTIHTNINQPSQIRMDFGLSPSAKNHYLLKICTIKDWLPTPSNVHRAEIILDNLLIIEKQNPDLCIVTDFELLWSLAYQAGRNN